MEPLNIIETPAIPLALANVDTDQLIPARFMKRPRAAGYGPFLLYDLRNIGTGQASDSLLDDPQRAGAAVMIARRNFGCGSSREAAVYALLDYGIRCVIAPSFGDIFASNAIKNGVLPARVSEADAEELLASPSATEGRAIRVDLAAQTIIAGNLVVLFTIDPVWKTQLLNGWDDIDLTMAERPAIDRFRAQDLRARPWAAVPDGENTFNNDPVEN
ncbi:3-isopropylmalate dehydratase small subunit [Methylocapsa sp. S129]|uniref:3-isopropylmalate dehydratase small subunit n=1 Tax=Methylocapsa sp. S129 TaxID=1641869 RepID=UPI00131A9E9A|nr:3-isopropylmalate dehydratase small subunit [Methylocapsa sp. S129]